MKASKLYPTFLSIIFLLSLTACVNSEKKSKSPSEENKKEAVGTSEETSIALPQKGDYKKLFALDDQCKITKAEIATLYGISTSDVKETYNHTNNNGGTYCSFHLSLNNNTETVFGVTSFKMPNAQVRDEISNWVTGSYEKKFLQISDSGDHYIWKHPNQGYYMLYNPAYANGIKIQYRTMLKMDETQKKYLEQKGIQALDYLIEKYKN
tara:strand:- start:405 stop:1031 length:627 start_codon:yes stop_codon:yes gene_type:complete